MKPRKDTAQLFGRVKTVPNILTPKAIDIPSPEQSVSPITVSLVTGVDELNALRSDWESLVSKDPAASPFASWNWVQSWLNVYGVKRQIVSLVCRQGNEIVGIVPFSWTKHLSPLALRKLWMFGFQDGLGNNELTEEPVMALSSQPEIRDRVWSAIHQEVKDQIQDGPWDIIAYRKFGKGIEGCSLVEVKSKSVVVQQYLRGCETVRLPDSWETYVKSLTKSMRENISYYKRKFLKSNIGYTVEFVAGDEIHAVISTMVNLHKKRTYQDEQLAHVDYFTDPRQKSLLVAALKEMIPTGQAQLAVLKSEGKIIAVQAFLKNDRMLVAHYSGFDPDWSKFSPLFVLQSHVIKHGIENGIETLNLLRGNASWQRRWGANAVDQIIDVTIAKRSVFPRIRQLLNTHESKALQALSNAPSIQRARAKVRLLQIKSKVA